MKEELVSVAIVNYPNALKSAVFGFEEIFQLSNGLSNAHGVKQRFLCKIIDADQFADLLFSKDQKLDTASHHAVIIPPSINSSFCHATDDRLINWLLHQHAAGAIICSVCAGAFLLAATGLLRNRPATTHWGLTSEFSQRYPETRLDTDQILINDGDLITAGGIMAWIDLGLELVSQFVGSKIMRQLAKQMVIDSGLREQRYYHCFTPKLNHHDKAILRAQHHINSHYNKSISVSTLAELSCLSERMFLRRFVKATDLKPTEYLQNFRIQKACELIETTETTFENIGHKVGYKDISAFRKIFQRINGLTPGEFRKRFMGRQKTV